MDPRNEFDQTGCAWPRAPLDPATHPGKENCLPTTTDDYAQPDAAASETVFWTEPNRPDEQATHRPTPTPPTVAPTPPQPPPRLATCQRTPVSLPENFF